MNGSDIYYNTVSLYITLYALKIKYNKNDIKNNYFCFNLFT